MGMLTTTEIITKSLLPGRKLPGYFVNFFFVLKSQETERILSGFKELLLRRFYFQLFASVVFLIRVL